MPQSNRDLANVSVATLAQVTVMPAKRGDDAFGRSAHKASESAQIEARLIRLKTREDHGSLTVCAKRALAGRFASEKRSNGMIEHGAFPLISAGAQHSQSPIDAENRAMMEIFATAQRELMVKIAHS